MYVMCVSEISCFIFAIKNDELLKQQGTIKTCRRWHKLEEALEEKPQILKFATQLIAEREEILLKTETAEEWVINLLYLAVNINHISSGQNKTSQKSVVCLAFEFQRIASTQNRYLGIFIQFTRQQFNDTFCYKRYMVEIFFLA